MKRKYQGPVSGNDDLNDDDDDDNQIDIITPKIDNNENENKEIMDSAAEDHNDVKMKRLAKLEATQQSPNESSRSSSSDHAAAATFLEGNDSTRSPSTKEATLKKPPPNTTPSSSKPPLKASDSSSSNKKFKRQAVRRPPEFIFIQALSHLTGLAVESSDGIKAKPSGLKKINNKNTTTTSGVPVVVRLDIKAGNKASNDDDVSINWEELGYMLRTSSSDFFVPFRSHLFPHPSSKFASLASLHYGSMSRIEDGPLYKMASIYSSSTTWIRDNSTSMGLNNDDRESLSSCLQSFRQWIVDELVKELRHEIDEGGMDLVDKAGDNANFGSVELGLFQDESYGQLDTTTAVDYLGQYRHGKNTDTGYPFLDEIFRILGNPSGATVLGGSFMVNVSRTYDQISDDVGSLSKVLLSNAIQRLPSPDSTDSFDDESTRRQLSTLQNLVTSSPQVATAIATSTVEYGDSQDGAALESTCVLRPLFHLAAFTVPRFSTSNLGTSATTGGNNIRPQPFDLLLPRVFHSMLCSIGREYPICVYARRGYDAALASYNNVRNMANSTMKSARLAAVSILLKIAKAATKSNSRSSFFQWLNHLVDSNEALVDLLESDLLSPDTAQAYCSSRPFLLGITTSLLEMTLDNLWKTLERDGDAAFDLRYFYTDKQAQAKKEKCTGILVTSKDRCLIPPSTLDTEMVFDQPDRFSGSTEFFFLLGALLRLSLFSGFRVYDQYSSVMRHEFSKIYQRADQQPSKDELEAYPSSLYSPYQKCATTSIGWDVFVRSREISELITSFSLLQLKWCSCVAVGSPDSLTRIPEWLVKLPSQWIAYVSVHLPQSLKSNQGIDAVLFATKIMASSQSFSPPVLCQLIRIAGGFIKQGVRRARIKEQARFKRGKRHSTFLDEEPDDDFEDLIDDRTLDIYSSFDQRDLGVTVFTNKYIEEHLLPQLMKSYIVMDHAEGVDVEKEYKFEKFQGTSSFG
jgi:Ubiquitin elongating factor core